MDVLVGRCCRHICILYGRAAWFPLDLQHVATDSETFCEALGLEVAEQSDKFWIYPVHLLMFQVLHEIASQLLVHLGR